MDGFEDLELEVTSLREATQQNASPEADGHDTSQADGAPVARPAPHAGLRLTLHRRLIQMGIAGVCVVSLLVLVLGRSPATTAIVGNMFGIVTPTPTLPLTLGMDKIYPIYSVPWGTLRVDGRVQTFVVQQGNYQPVRLSRGSHTLEYQAAPFPALRCRISAPAAPTDTCPQVTTSPRLPFDPVPPDVRDLGREIDLGATPERLPASQRAALSAAIDAALNGDMAFHTDVAPGERYATANGGIAVATQPLTATLRMTHTPRENVVNGMAPLTIYGDSACADMCADVFPFDGNYSGWPVAVAATLAWRYTAANGDVVAEAPVVPASTGLDLDVASSPAAYSAHVAVLWERQQWTVHRSDANSLGASNLGNTLCALGQFLVDSMYSDLDQAGAYGTFGTNQYTPHQPADGCYITYQRGITAGKLEPTSGFLYRLGVVLAANAQAQRLFPKLPVADARDLDIIRQTGAPAEP